MTLTSYLGSKNNPVRIFLHERFPNTRILIKEIRGVGNSAKTIRPETVVPWSLLGTAIDFRIRGYYAPIMFHGFPSSELQLLWGEEEFEVFYMDLSQQLQSRAAEGHSVGARLERNEEEWLCRFCILLAMFDHIFRSGVTPPELKLIDVKATTPTALLADVPQEWVDDLCQMSWTFCDASADLWHHPVTLNPIFDGSTDVGGADADMILDNCLLEIKAAVSFKVSRPEWIYQLLGYTLLDYSDKHQINSLGFYLARQGAYIRWPLDAFITTLAGQKMPPVAELRAEFKRIAESTTDG